jgi:hypothetical protein
LSNRDCELKNQRTYELLVPDEQLKYPVAHGNGDWPVTVRRPVGVVMLVLPTTMVPEQVVLK